MPLTLFRCSTISSPLHMSVPGTSRKLDATRMGTLYTAPSSTARLCITRAPQGAGSPQGGDVHLLGDPLEAGDDDDLPFGQLPVDALRVHLEDAGAAETALCA